MFRKQYSTCFFRFNVKSDDGVRASSMLSLVLPFFKYISQMVSSNPFVGRSFRNLCTQILAMPKKAQTCTALLLALE